MEQVVLVDEKDREIGTGEKMAVHREGKLHRAFSIFVFNSKGELMIHRRAKEKYHSGGLWTNTCCSHPRPGEKLEEAVHRRLKEEMGLDCPLKEVFHFVYKVKFGNGLFEHELDHVFTGKYDGNPKPDPEEVEDWKWVGMLELEKDVKKNPDNYTYWFKAALPKLVSFLK
ncbi:MAG: isopentenyl-diphosphate Delta-isomerase [Candidatus Micrarchaeota archaeon]|nr:isopentenyl-diphosphate Delta-isomerase [Candidatus Micrarchaeota archaeon]